MFTKCNKCGITYQVSDTLNSCTDCGHINYSTLESFDMGVVTVGPQEGVVFEDESDLNEVSSDQVLERAKKLANNITWAPNFECPRGVINPGVYFGYVQCYNDLLEEIKELRKRIQELDKEGLG
jgi:hypothetical protein